MRKMANSWMQHTVARSRRMLVAAGVVWKHQGGQDLIEYALLATFVSLVSVAEVARDGFGIDFSHTLPATPPRYDFQSLHAGLFGGHGAYQYGKRDSIQAIRAYAQSEPRRVASGSSS